MDKQKTLKITVLFKKHEYDLEVPSEVSMNRLKELLVLTFIELGHPLPSKFELKVIDKSLTIDPQVVLSNYPIGNGDYFELSALK